MIPSRLPEKLISSRCDLPMQSLIARFMGPKWGLSGADRTQVGPMFAPRTLLSGMILQWSGWMLVPEWFLMSVDFCSNPCWYIIIDNIESAVLWNYYTIEFGFYNRSRQNILCWVTVTLITRESIRKMISQKCIKENIFKVQSETHHGFISELFLAGTNIPS